ncbi:MAG TPA: hypothetical protein VFI30_00700 [Nocardioidaceae bacterium]|nr:hypothetical protein [Nocardioidaceae bacterium]
MRWDELFADLEGQAVALATAEREAEVAERTRGELARVALLNRLRALAGGRLSAQVFGVGPVEGRLERVGADWLLLDRAGEVVVPVAAVALVRELPAEAVSPSGVSAVAARIPLTAVLRTLARDRSVVSAALRDGTTVIGTPDRVGKDWVDLAVHEPGEAPRRSTVRRRVTVPLAALALLRNLSGDWD